MIERKWSPFQIGKYEVRTPIVLGAGSIRVTGAGIANAVSDCGGAGTIGGVGRGIDSDYYKQGVKFLEADRLALRDELHKAHEINPNGLYGVNLLVAMTDYDNLVRVAVENGAKYIVSGAGLPTHLPELTRDYPEVALIPIASSVQGVRIICKRWWNRYQRYPDAVVIEDPSMAGGHLGITPKQNMNDAEFQLVNSVPDSREFLDDFVKKTGGKGPRIPIIAAGGIWNGDDIDRVLRLGAQGAQMTSRFVCTTECEAPDEFKQTYIDATQDAIVEIVSPVGIPGRAIRTKFLDGVDRGEVEDECMVGCLRSCKLRDTGETYCIVQALSNAFQGKINDAIVFAGKNAWRSNKIVTVRELFDELRGVNRI